MTAESTRLLHHVRRWPRQLREGQSKVSERRTVSDRHCASCSHGVAPSQSQIQHDANAKLQHASFQRVATISMVFCCIC